MTTVADAFVARLVSQLPAGIAIYDVAAPGIPPPRYVVVICDTGSRTAPAADGSSRQFQFDLHVMAVATENNSVRSAAPLCRQLQSAIQDAVIDWRPLADGLVVGPVVHLHTRQPVPDETIADRHTVFAIDQFRIQADRPI